MKKENYVFELIHNILLFISNNHINFFYIFFILQDFDFSCKVEAY